MRTKKIIAGVLAVASLAATMTAAAIVFAADGKVAVSVGNTEAAIGEEFTLSVNLSDIPEPGIGGCEFGIKYDSALVTVTDVKTGALADTGVSSVETGFPDPFECNIEANLISVMWATGTDDQQYYMKDSGEFLIITGTVNSDATAGAKADFSIVPIDRSVTPGSSTVNSLIQFGCLDSSGNAVVYDYTLSDGYVQIAGSGSSDVGATLYGDVDCSGSVDIVDVVLLNKYLLNKTAYEITAEGQANADCVLDGVIAANDSGKIQQYLAQLITADALGKA